MNCESEHRQYQIIVIYILSFTHTCTFQAGSFLYAVFGWLYLESTLNHTHLQHNRVFGGSRSGEVLHVPAALVVECRPTGLILAVPLDDVVAVEEILFQRQLTPQSQEVTCLLHFLYQDVPRPCRYHAHVNIPWESREGGQSHSEVMDGPP